MTILGQITVSVNAVVCVSAYLHPLYNFSKALDTFSKSFIGWMSSQNKTPSGWHWGGSFAVCSVELPSGWRWRDGIAELQHYHQIVYGIMERHIRRRGVEYWAYVDIKMLKGRKLHATFLYGLMFKPMFLTFHYPKIKVQTAFKPH